MSEVTESFNPHPSLSRDLATDASSPRLLHLLHEQNNSVLSLSTDDRHIYSGSQSNDISVWCKKTYRLVNTLKGHTGSILFLEYAAEKKWLFSSSGDSTVRVWCTKKLIPLYIINPYLETDAGDLFSLAWSNALQTIYVGCQDTSLQWFNFRSLPSRAPDPKTGTSTPSRKVHKFFDSYPQSEHKPADIHAKNSLSNLTDALTRVKDQREGGSALVTGENCHIPATNVIDSAHYGYVYCMALIPSTRDIPGVSTTPKGQNVHLVTGSGDETVKLWECTASGPSILHTFTCSHGAVLSIAVRDNDTIYVGCQDGYVKVWDLETKTLIRTLIVQENVDILSLSMIHSDLYTCSANGRIQRWSTSFDCTASWLAHEGGIVLSSIIDKGERPGEFRLITGGSDEVIKIWQVVPPKLRDTAVQETGEAPTSDAVVHVLSKFVSIPSISRDLKHREDCRHAAIWLKKCLSQLGAQATLLPTGESVNPLVIATFHGTEGEHPKPRLLFYGHYDVISAPKTDWASDPFTLSGRNGYVYGRGVTDNKGPIMAVACAAAELLGRRALGLDLVFLIEGEEEAGSTGFADAVRKHKDLVGHIDAILVSNSTWITDDQPCLTYGLRGVVHCSIEISSGLPDLHSGIEGGAIVEPMMDMVRLLSSLTDNGRHVKIPGFYDRVRQQPEDEKELFERLAEITGRSVPSMTSRWREPSFTVHTIQMSGPQNSTVIPSTVKSQVSLRIVPDQDLEMIARSLSVFLETSFKNLQSPNKLQVHIEHTADWWLGNLDDPWFKALESAVQDEWGVKPLRIREGGTIPSVPYLEKEFGCHALHLPLGQSSDQAHLPNERISITNLHRGKSAIERFLTKVGVDQGLITGQTR